MGRQPQHVTREGHEARLVPAATLLLGVPQIWCRLVRSCSFVCWLPAGMHAASVGLLLMSSRSPYLAARTFHPSLNCAFLPA